MVAQYPLIPVILMTGRGNEETAVRALRAGATSYVPKSMMQTFLLDTVQSVLNAAEQEQCEIRLLDCLRHSDTTFQLRNDVNMIAPLVNHLHRTIRAIGVCDHTCGIRVSVALEEAINNAMFHGNLEITSAERTGDREAYRVLLAERLRTPPYCERTIDLQAKVTTGRGHLHHSRSRTWLRSPQLARPDRSGESGEGQRTRPPLDAHVYGLGGIQSRRQ